MSKFLDLTGLTYFYQKLKDKFALKSQQLPTIANKTLNTTTGSMTLGGIDLNTVVTSGFYSVSNCTNSAYSEATLIVTGQSSSQNCSQIEIDITTGNMSIRVMYDGTWSNWNEMTKTTINFGMIDISHDGNQTVTISEADPIPDANDISY